MQSSESESSVTESRKKMRLSDETAKELGTDLVAIILSFLRYDDILRARVCTTWRDAARKTIVPLTYFRVDSVRKVNAMRAISTALPNLQQLLICKLGHGHKYSDGEDPDEEWAARTVDETPHNIDIISRFSKLRRLDIFNAPSNGRYPVLFNFPLLQKLSIRYGRYLYLKWDLEMLSGLPFLKELGCYDAHLDLTGSLSSLRVLKDTLEEVVIQRCPLVRGTFTDLADFPRLKKLDLGGCTVVTGDIRDISEHDFPALESLSLPHSVHGGIGFKFRRFLEVPSFMHAIQLLLQRSPTMFESDLLSGAFYWRLSRHSPDWYEWDDDSENPKPPFSLQFVQAGSRLGWSWICCSNSGSDSDGIYNSDSDDDNDDDLSEENSSCEINWLDPEPSSESSNYDYEAYMEELQRIEQRINFYRGYHQPPTEEEYRRLCELLY
jgi:hypothetical protein